MISCKSSLTAFLELCLPASFSWTSVGSQDQHTWSGNPLETSAAGIPTAPTLLLQSITLAWQPCQACIPLAVSNFTWEQALILWSTAEQHVPGPGATIPVDGIKDSSFLCWIWLQGLFSHSSTPHSPISQQLWSRYSCKKSRLLIKSNLWD